jgi:penicillin-binding protein 2
MRKRRRSSKKLFRGAGDISPDEIFLDSKNIPKFDKFQLEGRLEKPISQKIPVFVAILCFLLFTPLIFRVGYLQLVKGADFAQRAEDNRLEIIRIPAERGLIYDRNGEILARNDPVFNLVLENKVFDDVGLREEVDEFLKESGNARGTEELIEKSRELGKDLIAGVFYDWLKVSQIYNKWSGILPLRIEHSSLRRYKESSGLGHLLGYLGEPSLRELKKERFVPVGEKIGKDGVELQYEKILEGKPGFKIIELDSKNRVQNEYVREEPKNGEGLHLTIDARIQEKLYKILEKVVLQRGFQAGSAVILDVSSGEVLALTNYPEYSSNVLTLGQSKETINQFLTDSRKPFLNRAIAGLYAPGSVIKPFIALAALNEKIIDPLKKIYDSGSISIPNPYFPNKKSVFYDWKAHGFVDMKKAIALSCNVYFYTIGGGYKDVTGLGIKKIRNYLTLFGLGKKSGIDLYGEKDGLIPGPELKAKNEKDPIWRIGDTYNASIGQGDLQVTPIQMAVAAAAIANGGRLVKPHVNLADKQQSQPQIAIPKEYFQIVKEGMREAALTGTAKALGGLPVEIAAKTGTAELAKGKFVNSWLIAFWPYKNPRFSAAIVLEKGSASNLIGGVSVFHQLISWIEDAKILKY